MRSQLQLADGSLFDIRRPGHHIPIRPLALGCARACRYAGQLPAWVPHYSVAEHMVHVGRAVRDQIRADPLYANYPESVSGRLIRTAYLHDLQEGVLGDMPTPLKTLCPDYQSIETAASRSIAYAFRTTFPLPEIVAEIDARIILDERMAIDGDSLDRARWGIAPDAEPLGIKIEFWQPLRAFDILIGDLEEIGVLAG